MKPAVGGNIGLWFDRECEVAAFRKAGLPRPAWVGRGMSFLSGGSQHACTRIDEYAQNIGIEIRMTHPTSKSQIGRGHGLLNRSFICLFLSSQCLAWLSSSSSIPFSFYLSLQLALSILG